MIRQHDEETILQLAEWGKINLFKLKKRDINPLVLLFWLSEWPQLWTCFLANCCDVVSKEWACLNVQNGFPKVTLIFDLSFLLLHLFGCLFSLICCCPLFLKTYQKSLYNTMLERTLRTLFTTRKSEALNLSLNDYPSFKLNLNIIHIFSWVW